MAKKKKVKKGKKVKKNKKFECQECGLVVNVVDECGCSGACDLECCGEPMVAC